MSWETKYPDVPIGRHATVEDAAGDLGMGPYWIAHEHPERGPDRWTIWDWACRACFIHLCVAALNDDDDERAGNTVHDNGSVTEGHSLAEIAAEATAWRIEQGLW